MNLDRDSQSIKAGLLIACVTAGACCSPNQQCVYAQQTYSNGQQGTAVPTASDVGASNTVEEIDFVVVAFISAVRDETYRLLISILKEHGISPGLDGSNVVGFALYVPRWQSAEATRLLKEDKRLAVDRIKFPAVIK